MTLIRALNATPAGYEAQIVTGNGCEWEELTFTEYCAFKNQLRDYLAYQDGSYRVYNITRQQESQAAADHEAWCAEMDENASRGQGWL
jgi:hypothetical protein